MSLPTDTATEARVETRPQMLPMVTRMYATPDDLMAALDAYRDACAAEERPLTYVGTARVCGVDRRTLWEYLSGMRRGLSEEWIGPLKEGAARVEEQDEGGLRGPHPVGHLFALKNRGWSDRQEVEHSGTLGGLVVSLDLSAAANGVCNPLDRLDSDDLGEG